MRICIRFSGQARRKLMTEDDDISANIEWGQKKSLSDNTRMSRRINIKKVLESEAKDRKNFKATSKQIKNLPPSLKKLRIKIKDVYDEEDEDEDENEVIFHFSLEDENSSLLNALKEDEKSKLQFQKTLENQKLQQTAGKMEALLTADKMSKQVGLKGLKRKVINDGIQDIAQNDDTFNKALVRDVAAKTKIKIRPEKMSRRETADMIKGLNKLQKAATVVEQPKENLLDDLKTEELIRIGKNRDEQKTAEIILEKSGRKEARNNDKQDKKKEQQKVKTALQQAKVRE